MWGKIGKVQEEKYTSSNRPIASGEIILSCQMWGSMGLKLGPNSAQKRVCRVPEHMDQFCNSCVGDSGPGS